MLFALDAVLPDGSVVAQANIALANAALALGYGLVWGGARRFAGDAAWPAGIAAGAGAWLLLTLIPGFTDLLPARVVAVAVVVVAYDGATALAFRAGMVGRAGVPGLRLPSHGMVVGLLLAHGLVFTLRGLVAGLRLLPAIADRLPPMATATTILLILSLALTASLTVALVALTRERAALAAHAGLTAARDAAAAASAEKSRFLARMSHELRTPLNGVLGLAEALARDPLLLPRQREQAETLERAGRHLLAIVNDVLDLARVEAGRLELLPAPVGLRALLEEALELIQPAATAKRIRLQLDLAPPLPEAVLADAVRLRQILLNLLGNAVKFAPETGSVALRAEQAADGRLRLTVTDSGPGVPDALRPRLFGEFAQGPQEEAGTGLGLAISAALARSMGGTLDHAPGPAGRGSAFTALLPLPTAEPPSLPTAEPMTLPTAEPMSLPAAEPMTLSMPEPPSLPKPPPAGLTGPPPAVAPRPLRLLVVDDARLNREVVRALLRPDGHQVEEAEDGSAAVAAMRCSPLPDVVLMDVNMPGMDGFRATAAIRALGGEASRVPVIALTGDAMPEAVAAGRAAGMDGHLTKPLRRAVLLAELARVLPGR